MSICLFFIIQFACSSRVIECSEYESARQKWLIFRLYYASSLHEEVSKIYEMR